MDKSILISIQPQHVVNILNGKKILEIRKTVPKGFKGWVYIYCTKHKPLLTYDVFDWDSGWVLYDSEEESYSDKAFNVNGKVVARFWFNEWTEIRWLDGLNKKYAVNELMLQNLCLSYNDLSDYGKEKDLYAWHIKKLEVFDEPMSLSDFYKDNQYPDGKYIGPQICTPSPFDCETDNYQKCLNTFKVIKAPQSWQYVWRNEQ